MPEDLLDELELDEEFDLGEIGDEELDELVKGITEDDTEDTVEEKPSSAKKKAASKPSEPKETTPKTEKQKATPAEAPSPASVPSASSPFAMLQQVINYRVAMIESGAIKVAGGEESRNAVVENLKWVSEFISLLNR